MVSLGHMPAGVGCGALPAIGSDAGLRIWPRFRQCQWPGVVSRMRLGCGGRLQYCTVQQPGNSACTQEKMRSLLVTSVSRVSFTLELFNVDFEAQRSVSVHPNP